MATEIGNYFKNIDNGGIDIRVMLDDDSPEYKQIAIEMSTSYYDYPSIQNRLDTWGRIGEKELKEIGLMFISAANKLKEQKVLCESE